MAWQAGERVGPYEIVAQLGQGGMATVYKAYHPQLDRHIAIKVMHQTFMAEDTFVSRFRREAQIVARLEHPHIVPVYDFNEHMGQPYLVMKYVEGQTLKQRMFKKPLSLDEVVYVMNAVGSALAYAHTKGVLHRDVKPSNIVIDTENIPYLADFGLARIVAAGESTLSADVLLGTPNYISPEQAGGRKDLDGRTDIYSLGIVLYELLVGQVPFTGDTPYAVIHDHIYTPIPEPSKVNPEIPLSVETVLLKATAKKPDDRYSTADDLINDLKEAIEESRLERLSADRSSIASVSLSRLRDELSESVSAGQRTLPLPGAIASPLSGTVTPSGLRTATLYQPRQNGRLWMLGGCGSVLLIGLIGIGVLLGAWNNILEFGEIMTSLRGTISDPLLITMIADEDTPFEGLPVYPVPEIPVEAANEVMNDPNSGAIMSLAAADAYWDTDPAKSYLAISSGDKTGENTVTYLTTAAILADDNEDYAAAAVYTLLALYEADKTPPVYDQLRPAAGAYLYDVAHELSGAEAEGIALEIVGELYSAAEVQEIDDSAPRFFLTARTMLVNGSERLAALISRRPADESGFRAELVLLQGEIAAAQGKMSNALTFWQSIVDEPGAPEWVVERANELLEENNTSS